MAEGVALRYYRSNISPLSRKLTLMRPTRRQGYPCAVEGGSIHYAKQLVCYTIKNNKKRVLTGANTIAAAIAIPIDMATVRHERRSRKKDVRKKNSSLSDQHRRGGSPKTSFHATCQEKE